MYVCVCICKKKRMRNRNRTQVEYQTKSVTIQQPENVRHFNIQKNNCRASAGLCSMKRKVIKIYFRPQNDSITQNLPNGQ